ALRIKSREIAHRSKTRVIDQEIDLQIAFHRLVKKTLRRIWPGEIHRDKLRPSSLHNAISLSSVRATSKRLCPRAASLRANASPIPEDAPVMSVVFIEASTNPTR